MTENRKYYYLKLKEDFFESEDIKLLESMDNGYLYSNILLKMYLKSLKNKGELIFKDFIPYDVKMLATITGHNVDVVEKALRIFKQLGFIEVLDNGTIFMLDIQNFVGQISTEGKRKAAYREKIKQERDKLLPNGTNLGQCPDIMSMSMSKSMSISKSMSNSISNNNLDSIRESEEKSPMATFFDKWSISCENLTNYSAGQLGNFDFDKLETAMNESNYLRTENQPRFIEFYLKNYKKVISGYYKDRTATKKQETREIDDDFLNDLNGIKYE